MNKLDNDIDEQHHTAKRTETIAVREEINIHKNIYNHRCRNILVNKRDLRFNLSAKEGVK